MKSTKKQLSRPLRHVLECLYHPDCGDGVVLSNNSPVVFATADGRWAQILSVYWDHEKKTIVVDIGDEQGE